MERKKEIEDKLGNFSSSFGAAVHLFQSAKNKECYVEQVCLCANIIDALLRFTLLIKEQIDSNTDDVNEAYLFQSEKDKIISEKMIYKIAKNKAIINSEIYNELYSLYLSRNKIIHRFIISDIKTTDLKETAAKYEKMMDIINEKHRIYYNEQVSKGIGISKLGIRNPTLDQMADEILKKHNGLYKKKQ